MYNHGAEELPDGPFARKDFYEMFEATYGGAGGGSDDGRTSHRLNLHHSMAGHVNRTATNRV